MNNGIPVKRHSGVIPHHVPDPAAAYAVKVRDSLSMLALPEPGTDVRLWRSRVTTRHLLPLTYEVGFMLDGGEAVRVAALAEVAPMESTPRYVLDLSRKERDE